MKNQLILLSAITSLMTVTLHAQSTGQLRAGFNLANVSVNNNGKVDDANMLSSFQVGFIGNVPLTGSVIALQPGILFTGKGSKIQRGSPSESGYFKQTSNPYYIELPVNLVFKAPIGTASRFFAGAGPYLAIGIAGKNKTEGRTILGTTFNSERDIEFSNDDPTTFSEEEGTGFGVLKRFDYGLNGTAGIEGKSVVLGVNYGLGLAKLQSGGNSSQDNNNKHRVLSFTLGFKL
jgi:hypothetical protein